MKLKYNTVQVILEVVGLLSITAMIIYSFIAYAYAPETIPVHFGADGVANSWAEKRTIFLMPAFSVILYIIISAVAFYPSSWNMPVEITENNSEKVYSAVKTMVLAMKFLIICIFFYIMYIMAQAKNLPISFLFVSLSVFAVTITFFIVYTIYVGKKYA